MSEIKPHLVKYLEYVQNTGGNATVADFDEDWEPIGPTLRGELMPQFMFVGSGGKLALTEHGRAALLSQ